MARDAKVCERCNNPVHIKCAETAASAPVGRCPDCGGDPALAPVIPEKRGGGFFSSPPSTHSPARYQEKPKGTGRFNAKGIVVLTIFAAIGATIATLAGLKGPLGMGIAVGIGTTIGMFVAIAVGGRN